MSWTKLAQQLGLAGAIIGAAFVLASKITNGQIEGISANIDRNRDAIHKLETAVIRIDERLKIQMERYANDR